MKKLFIVNSRAESKALARFKASYFDYSVGHENETSVVFTEFAGHAGEAASRAASEEDLLVVACGGDGTIHEVANETSDGSNPFVSEHLKESFDSSCLNSVTTNNKTADFGKKAETRQ